MLHIYIYIFICTYTDVFFVMVVGMWLLFGCLDGYIHMYICNWICFSKKDTHETHQGIDYQEKTNHNGDIPQLGCQCQNKGYD